MAALSANTTKTTVWTGSARVIGIFNLSSSSDVLEVYLNGDTVAAGNIPPGQGVPFRRDAFQINSVAIKTRTGTGTAEINTIDA